MIGMRGNARHWFGRTVSLLPSLLLAVGWIAIWFLWPQPGAGAVRRVRSVTALSVCRLSAADRLYRNPDLFGPASPMGFSPAGTEGDAWRTPWSRKPLRPFELARVPEAGSGAREPARVAPVAGPAPDYVPEFGRVSAGLRSGPRAPALHVRPAPGLAAAGFAPPAFEADGEWPEQWEAEAIVEVNARGLVDAVFVTRGSGYPRVDRRVEGWLARATVTNRGERVAGAVIVSRSP